MRTEPALPRGATVADPFFAALDGRRVGGATGWTAYVLSVYRHAELVWVQLSTTPDGTGPTLLLRLWAQAGPSEAARALERVTASSGKASPQVLTALCAA